MSSLEIAILRLKEQESISKKSSQNLKVFVYQSWLVKIILSCTLMLTWIMQNLAKDEYESNFVSAVVPPGEIGVKFDDVGALEDVKKALNELVILPMQRPDLFSHGNLLRVLNLCNLIICFYFSWCMFWCITCQSF